MASGNQMNRDWPAGGPFDLDDDESYRRWRDERLSAYPRAAEELLVEIRDPAALTAAEHAALLDRCRRANMAIYAVTGGDEAPAASDMKARLACFGAAFGLRRLDHNLCADEDGIAALEVRDSGPAGDYVPYSDRSLSWHTDGYYNAAAEQVRAVILHCARSAATGGGNALMDPEIAYIRLRDEDPAHIAALMHPHALTIPANRTGGVEVRPARTGPVFSVDAASGALHMRYSARKVNVVWRDDAATQAAVAALGRLLGDEGPDILHWRLAAGQGYIGNNVLHNRAAFRDEPGSEGGRLLYRARYFDRMEGV